MRHMLRVASVAFLVAVAASPLLGDDGHEADVTPGKGKPAAAGTASSAPTSAAHQEVKSPDGRAEAKAEARIDNRTTINRYVRVVRGRTKLVRVPTPAWREPPSATSVADEVQRRWSTPEDLAQAVWGHESAQKLQARVSSEAVSYTHLTLPTTPYV